MVEYADVENYGSSNSVSNSTPSEPPAKCEKAIHVILRSLGQFASNNYWVFVKCAADSKYKVSDDSMTHFDPTYNICDMSDVQDGGDIGWGTKEIAEKNRWLWFNSALLFFIYCRLHCQVAGPASVVQMFRLFCSLDQTLPRWNTHHESWY